MRSLRHLLTWFQTRNLRWIVRRLLTLLRTYGLTSAHAKRRVTACTELVERYGGLPSFATPGRVVDADPEFFRALAGRGVELAIHGYDHIHFDSLDGDEARRQFERAAAAYAGAGIEFTGFRCPYLSYSAKVTDALPDGLFSYSSNLAIRWDARAPVGGDEKILAQLQSFYTPLPAAETVARPRQDSGLVEIPASLPDDFELEHGFKLSDEGIADVWNEIFERTFELGELFAPLFHPESFDRCALAFERVLASAASRTPPVWIARLSDIADWWLRRSAVQVRASGDGTITVDGDPEVTVLARGLELDGDAARPWGDGYAALQGRSLAVPDGRLPFVGAEPDTPEAPLRWLREEGFVIETGPDADRCAVRLDNATADELRHERTALDWIEGVDGPLVRIWRWPNGARSALCIAGDLDALSLRDYADRIRRA